MKGEQEPLGGSPAGRPTDAAGQQPEGVLVLNARDKRAIAWMIEQVGFVAVQEACGRLAGRRRLYPTNLAKVLGLTIPDGMEVASREEALRHLAAIRAKLKAISR